MKNGARFISFSDHEDREYEPRTNEAVQLPIDVTTIQTLIPHRYPFLLVDKVVELDIEGTRIVCRRNVGINESFFQGHFPTQPIMRGVLIIEALAQDGGVLTQLSLGRDAQSKSVCVRR